VLPTKHSPPLAQLATVSVNVAVVLPDVLVAVIVYVVAVCAAVGVPVIRPVVVLKESPAGNVPVSE
jgi:hypothetical protein